MSRKKSGKSRQRRPSGTGTFFKSEARGVYIARVQVGKKPDGSPHYVERSDRTEAGLVAKLANIGPPGPKTTVAQWLARWLDEMDVRGRTKKIRETAVKKYFTPTLGHLKVAELTSQQINRASVEWAKSLEANTVRMHLAVLHTAMKAAQQAGLRADNPAAAAKKPPAKKKDINPFTPAELSRVIAEALGRPATFICALIAATGCRGGEALALDVPHYNPTTGCVTITQTADEDRELGPTKTSNGVRTIEVPEDARPAIVAAIGTRTKGPLFPTGTGRRQEKGVVRWAWKRMLGRLGLDYRNPHQCRHTIATVMLAANYSIADVAAYLGDTPESIMRTYCHPTGANVGAGIQAVLTAAKKAKANEQSGDKVGAPEQNVASDATE